MPRTAAALPATHGGHTTALLPSASPAETGAPRGGQGLCLLRRDAGLPRIQTCRDTGMQSYLQSITAGIQGTASTAGIPPIHHCRDTGHWHGRDRGAPASLRCRHGSTASLAL